MDHLKPSFTNQAEPDEVAEDMLTFLFLTIPKWIVDGIYHHGYLKHPYQGNDVFSEIESIQISMVD